MQVSEKHFVLDNFGDSQSQSRAAVVGRISDLVLPPFSIEDSYFALLPCNLFRLVLWFD